MIRFYFHPAPNPMKIALFLEEAGLEYETVPVDTRKGEQFLPDFLAINPNGKTPALTDGDAVLFDSTAILLHLAARFGKFAADGSVAEHTRMLSWLLFIASGLGPFTGQAVHFKMYVPQPDPYALNRYTFEAERHWGLIEARLGQAPYLAGDAYSIADISLWGWARGLPFLFGPEAFTTYPNVKRLVDEIAARPASARAEALASRFSFKQEVDAQALKVLFPQNARLEAK